MSNDASGQPIGRRHFLRTMRNFAGSVATGAFIGVVTEEHNQKTHPPAPAPQSVFPPSFAPTHAPIHQQTQHVHHRLPHEAPQAQPVMPDTVPQTSVQSEDITSDNKKSEAAKTGAVLGGLAYIAKKTIVDRKPSSIRDADTPENKERRWREANDPRYRR